MKNSIILLAIFLLSSTMISLKVRNKNKLKSGLENVTKIFSKIQTKNQTKETPGQWVDCGGENATCSFKGTSIVRYGKNETWLYKEAADSQLCSYKSFGKDPLPGVEKKCQYFSPSEKIPHAWKDCGGEDDVCKLDGPTIIKYGVNSSWDIQLKSGNVNCNYITFVDVAPSVRKRCYILQYPKSTSVINVKDWVDCGSENATCSFKGTSIVRYGKNETWLYKEAANSQLCSYNSFGRDPLPGVDKICQYLSPSETNPHLWKDCGGENATCKLDGSTIIKYGVDSRWAIQLKNGDVSCSYKIFSDVAPGTSKRCYILQYPAQIEAIPIVNVQNGSEVLRDALSKFNQAGVAW